ncbi:putative RNA polymerase sigma factor FecI [compost metagenome]
MLRLNRKHYYSCPFPQHAAKTPMRPRRPGFFEHYEELIGTWTRRLRNRAQAEDLAHDTFVRVLESDSAAVQQPRAYLHQTARNIAVDGYRREDRRGAMESQDIDHSESSIGDPEHYMRAIQLADSIERALAELPINCRKIFVWQKIEGLTQAEIAERLGLSKNMVEKYMIRTLRHLRDRLDGLQS